MHTINQKVFLRVVMGLRFRVDGYLSYGFS
jgi:hypothetical protein